MHHYMYIYTQKFILRYIHIHTFSPYVYMYTYIFIYMHTIHTYVHRGQREEGKIHFLTF
jgi:hypothetical protein